MKKLVADTIVQIILIILFLIHSFVQIRAQRPVFKQIILPSEIRSINALHSNNENTVWLATAQGLYSYSNKVFKRYYNDDQSDLFQINTIESDANGSMWFGTYNGQLVQFSNGSIIKSYTIGPYSKSDNLLITSITIDSNIESTNPEILLTTSGGEIFAIDTLKKSVKQIDSPSKGTIYSIQYGYTPTVWLCASDGFFTMNKNSRWKKKTGLYTAYGLFENENKYWAIGRDEEKKAVLMLYYDGDNRNSQKRYVWKNFELNRLTKKHTRFYELGFTNGEMAWIASQNGLIRYNPLDANIKLYSKDKKLNISKIQHIAVQNNKLLWISSSGKRFIRVELR